MKEALRDKLLQDGVLKGEMDLPDEIVVHCLIVERHAGRHTATIVHQGERGQPIDRLRNQLFSRRRWLEEDTHLNFDERGYRLQEVVEQVAHIQGRADRL